MNSPDALRELRLPESPSVEAGITAMFEFYRDVRADDCVIADDGDMLLYQWSPGQLDITRQFIAAGADDDDIWHLSLTWQVGETDLPRGHRWCSTPGELAEFETFVRSHPAYLAAIQAPASRFTLDFSPAG